MSVNKNTFKDIFPVQKLSMNKKDTSWKESCVDYIIGKSGTTSFDRKKELDTYYGLYNSEFDLDDLKYVTNPYNVEDGFPATLQNFNIIKPKIDLLLGEESKRPNNIRVIQSNYNVISEVQKKKKQLLQEYIINKSGINLDNPTEEDQMTLDDIQKYMSKTYKTQAEIIAHKSLKSLWNKLNIPYTFNKAFKDLCIASELIYYTGIVNGEPYFERVNPKECDYDRDSETEFIEDGEWFLREVEMTPSAIYDRFFDLLEPSDLDKLLSMVNGEHSIKKGSDVNTSSIVQRSKITDSIFSDKNEDNTYRLTVYHAVWRSYKKVGFLKYVDEYGEEQQEYVDESYKADPGEDIEWDWIVEIWEGFRIGEDMYIGMQPIENQIVSFDNPNSAKLPYSGIVFNNTNTKAKSLVAIMKPLQYMYIILWYRLELALARDKGRVITMDITQVPKSMGLGIHEWMHYLTSSGVNFVNPYEEGWDIPGREGGKPSSFNQMTSLDLTMSDVIIGYIQLIEKVESMIGEISGVSEARQGQIHRSELVGNVEREVTQSSHITEPLFQAHTRAKINAITNLINSAKIAWKDSDKKTLSYILEDGSRDFINITEDFIYADFDIYFADSTKEDQNIQSLKSLLQPAMQNGASLLDATEVLLSENVSEIKLKLEELDKARAEAQKAAMEADQQIKQMENQMKMEELRIKEEDSIRKADTDLQVAMIQAESKMYGDLDVNDNSIKDTLDKEKINLQKEKQKSDAELKQKQLFEEIRQNRVSEQIKREELKIKKQQANKQPVKNK